MSEILEKACKDKFLRLLIPYLLNVFADSYKDEIHVYDGKAKIYLCGECAKEIENVLKDRFKLKISLTELAR